MADTLSLRRSPLAGHAGMLAATSVPGPRGVRLRERPFLSMVNVRADPHSAGATAIAERVAELPVRPNTVTDAGERSVLWLGPDEWLAVGPDGDAAAMCALLGGQARSVVDVSANRTTVEVAGPNARDLLEKGCTIDLHPRAFGPGRCAQTMLARAQVVLWQVSEEPAYLLLVRSSFAGYLADWLADAAAEYAAREVPA